MQYLCRQLMFISLFFAPFSVPCLAYDPYQNFARYNVWIGEHIQKTDDLSEHVAAAVGSYISTLRYRFSANSPLHHHLGSHKVAVDNAITAKPGVRESHYRVPVHAAIAVMSGFAPADTPNMLSQIFLGPASVQFSVAQVTAWPLSVYQPAGQLLFEIVLSYVTVKEAMKQDLVFSDIIAPLRARALSSIKDLLTELQDRPSRHHNMIDKADLRQMQQDLKNLQAPIVEKER